MTRRAAGEGSIHQRRDGRWVAALTVGYVDGRQRRKYYYGHTQAEVRRKLNRAQRDRDQGIPLPDERLSLGDYLEQWLEQSCRPRLRETTLRSYRHYVRKHIIPALGRTPLAHLTPAQVEALLNAKLRDGLSPRSVSYIRVILRTALRRAERHGLVARNVAALVEGIRVTRRPVSVPTPAEARAMLEALADDRLAALYVTALTLGLRSGELRGLRWDDVDFGEALLYVRQTMQRVGGKLSFTPPKTERSRRTLPLPAGTAAALLAHRERQELERLLAGPRWQENGLVFATTIGTPLDASNLVNHFQQALAQRGFPRLRLHDLRHACATFLLAEGVDLRVIMEVLGHSQITLTANTYSQVLPAVSHEAIARLGRLLGDAHQAS